MVSKRYFFSSYNSFQDTNMEECLAGMEGMSLERVPEMDSN